MAFKAVTGIKRQKVKSSQIAEIGYDEKAKVLEVMFVNKGSVYQYHPILHEAYAGLTNAQSIGKYFHQNIKSNTNVEFQPVQKG